MTVVNISSTTAFLGDVMEGIDLVVGQPTEFINNKQNSEVRGHSFLGALRLYKRIN